MLTEDSGPAAAPGASRGKVYVMFFTQALGGRLNLRVEHTEDRKKGKAYRDWWQSQISSYSQQPYPQASPAGNGRSRKRKLMF